MADFQMASTPGRSRFSKALPAPPSGLLQIDSSTRGKASPFPTGQRGKTSPFPSPRPLPTPSKASLPRTPASGISTPSPPIVEKSLPTPKTLLPRTLAPERSTPFPERTTSVPRTSASGSSNQDSPPEERKTSLPRSSEPAPSNQSATFVDNGLPTPPLPTPLRIVIPKTKTNMPIQIPRRPVGGAAVGGGEGIMSKKIVDSRESVGSVSSIYSDYGRPRSSTGSSYVTKDSSVSSDHDDFLPHPPPKDPRRTGRESQEKLLAPGGIDARNGLSKDRNAQDNSTSSPQQQQQSIYSPFHDNNTVVTPVTDEDSPKSNSHATGSEPQEKPSPSKPPLWRRRSTKGSVNIAELTLTKSNGFTASPVSVTNISPVAQSQLPAPFQLPRSIGNHPGLPGRNIRKPVPARPAPPQPQSTQPPPPPSKAVERSVPSKSIQQTPKPETTVTSDSADMPPVLDKIKSKLGMKKEDPEDRSDELDGLSKIMGQIKEEFPTYVDPVDIRHQGLDSSNVPLPTYLQRPKPAHSSPFSVPNASETTIKALPDVAPDTPVEHAPELPPTHPTSGPQELVATTRAILARLPLHFQAGEISPAHVIDASHHECYAQHQKFIVARNEIHPVACQVCGKKDRESRFLCSFCCLRCCSQCHDAIRWDRVGNPERELGVVLRGLGRATVEQ